VGVEDARNVSEALNRAANRIAVEFSDWLAS
jgi:hypothetical protein